MNNPNLTGKEILGYTVTGFIGSGSFGTVYKAVKQNAAGSYIRALKHITIPTEKQYESVLNSMGGDYAKANDYFASSLEDIVNEIKILNGLAEDGAVHIVKYYENDIKVQDNPRRYDVYILMEYLTTLDEHIKANNFTVKDVVDLGLDVLEGLSACHRSGVIHRDIKDDNIFWSEKGGYKIGDFGVSKMLQNSARAESVKGTPNYIAPEVIRNGGSYNQSVDLYSLGIVLYRLLNYNRDPFLPPYPEAYVRQDTEEAYNRRIKGDMPPAPALAGHAIGNVILKAISSAADRYQEANDFYADLKAAAEAAAADVLARSIKPAGTAVDAAGSRQNDKAGEGLKATIRDVADNSVSVSVQQGGKQTNKPKNPNFDTITKESPKKTPDAPVVDTTRQETEKPEEPPFYQKYLTKEWGLRAAGALAALIIAAYFFFTGSPKAVVEDYISAIAAADYGKAYQCLDVKEQPTLGTAAYLQFVELARSSKEDNIYKISQNEIKSIELSDAAEKDGVLVFEASIKLNNKSENEGRKFIVYAEKKKTGPFGLFTGYRIAGTGIYAVPKINCLTGTEEVTVDDVKLADKDGKLNLNQPVFYGPHVVACKSKLYDAFSDRVNFDAASGMLKLDGRKFKLNSAAAEALAAASKEFAAAFFPAALTENGYKECKTVPDEKTIDEMYKMFCDGFKELGVASVSIRDGAIISAFAGDNGNIHCQYRYTGVYEANNAGEKQCNGTINFEYICDNGQLVVAKINDYNINLED